MCEAGLNVKQHWKNCLHITLIAMMILPPSGKPSSSNPSKMPQAERVFHAWKGCFMPHPQLLHKENGPTSEHVPLFNLFAKVQMKTMAIILKCRN